MPSPLERLIAGGKPAASPAQNNDLREIDDPTNLRAPVTVRQYVGVGGGDFASSIDSQVDDASRAVDDLLRTVGYQGDNSQQPDMRVVHAAAAQLKSNRGF